VPMKPPGAREGRQASERAPDLRGLPRMLRKERPQIVSVRSAVAGLPPRHGPGWRDAGCHVLMEKRCAGRRPRRTR
jgi:hypothetical protein